MPRKCLKAEMLKGFDPHPYRTMRMGEDLAHSLYAYRQLEKTVFIPDVLYHYIMNPNSTTHTVEAKNFQSCCVPYDIVMAFLMEEGITDRSVIEAIRTHYAWSLTFDIPRICGFTLDGKERVALLKQLSDNCKDILYGKIESKRLGRRLPLYLMLKYQWWFGCMILSSLFNFRNRVREVFQYRWSVN